jgi:hypothetical protein
MLDLICRYCERRTPYACKFCVHCGKVVPREESSVNTDKASKSGDDTNESADEESIQPLKLIMFFCVGLVIIFGIACFYRAPGLMAKILGVGASLLMLSLCWDWIDKARGKKCPSCGYWDVYSKLGEEELERWQNYELRTFQDVTRNAKWETLSTTTRQQQVLVTNCKVRDIWRCSHCTYSDSRERTKSWIN